MSINRREMLLKSDAFKGLQKKIAKAQWIDNGEKLKFKQDGDGLTVTCTDFPYGTNTVVRLIRLT